MSEDKEPYVYPNILCAAIANKDLNLAKNLIQLGSDPNLVCKKSMKNALQVALETEQFNFAGFLLNSGASISSEPFTTFALLQEKMEGYSTFNRAVDLFKKGSVKKDKVELNQAFNRMWFGEVLHQVFYFHKQNKENKQSISELFELCFSFYKDKLLIEGPDFNNLSSVSSGCFMMALVHHKIDHKPWAVATITDAIEKVGALEFYLSALEKIRATETISKDKRENSRDLFIASEAYLLAKHKSEKLPETKKNKL